MTFLPPFDAPGLADACAALRARLAETPQAARALALVRDMIASTDLPPIAGITRANASGLADVLDALEAGDLDAALDCCPTHEGYDDLRAEIRRAKEDCMNRSDEARVLVIADHGPLGAPPALRYQVEERDGTEALVRIVGEGYPTRKAAQEAVARAEGK